MDGFAEVSQMQTAGGPPEMLLILSIVKPCCAGEVIPGKVQPVGKRSQMCRA